MTFKQLLERHTIFKCLLLVLGLGTGIAYVHALVSPYMKIVLVLGFLIILGDLVRGKLELKDPAFWLLIAFAIGNCFTAYFNGGDYTARGIKDMAYMVMLFGLLFLKRKENDKELLSRERLVIAKVALVALIAMCVANVIAGYLLPGGVVELDDGVIAYSGFIDGRLYGLINTNVIGGISSITIILAAGLIIYGLKRTWLYVCVFGIAFGTYTLILTKSRTALLALFLVAIFAIIRFAVWKKLTAKGKKILIISGIVLVVLGLAGVGLAIYIMGYEDFYIFVYWLFTGRIEIWKYGLESFVESPILGISSQYFTYEVLVEPYIYARGGGIHSVYIGVIAYSGLLGVTALSTFTALNIKKDYCLVKSKTHISFGRNLCEVLLVFLLLEGITECYFLYGFGFFAVLFWMIMGMRRDG